MDTAKTSSEEAHEAGDVDWRKRHDRSEREVGTILPFPGAGRNLTRP